MQRLLFYAMIVIAIVIVVALIDLILYWLLRIFLAKHTAGVVNTIMLTGFIVTLSVSAWWGHTHTRLQLTTTQSVISSPRLPEAFNGFRIAQISDLHLNSFSRDEGTKLLDQLCQTIEQEQPDVIVFTGDIVTIRAAEAWPFKDELSRLSQIRRYDGSTTIPVYSILGNHDYADYVRHFTDERRMQDIDSLVTLQTTCGWHVLRNESVLLSSLAGDSLERIALIGVENIGEPPFSVYGDLDVAMQSIGGKEASDSLYCVLLSHNPTHWRSEVLPSTHIDLTLSGHTHATQILVGSWSPAKWKYDEWMGLYSQGQQYLYVNTGIGTVGPPVRIGIAPELSIITLHKQ